MSDFAHSVVLFSGEDGLPLEFNIQNSVDKGVLRAMIEHGGGFCTLSDDAIHVVSPGTKVLNVDPKKKLISTKYILDCVEQNFLLDIEEYRIEINEMETSDISDNSNNLVENAMVVERTSDADNSIDILEPNKSLSPNLICVASNHAFDFEESENLNNSILPNNTAHCEIPLQSPEVQANVSEIIKRNPESCVSHVPDSLENLDVVNEVEQNMLDNDINQTVENMDVSISKDRDAIIFNVASSPVSAVVSSSQSNEDRLDQFDHRSNNNENRIEQEEDPASQSYTVSSSADAQVSPKASPHDTSAEIFGGSSTAPDSASQTTERQQYITNLEREIEQILQKPSPKSIQDKIVLVKYICCVKKLAPAVVLQTLQNF